MDNEYDELVIGEAALLVWAGLPLETVAEASHSISPCTVMAVRATLAAEGMKQYE